MAVDFTTDRFCWVGISSEALNGVMSRFLVRAWGRATDKGLGERV